MVRPELKETLDNLPTKPGVYLYKNAEGTVIYVGKAVNLRARVRSYFHASAAKDTKTYFLVKDIASIEFIVAASELEALLLENTLIKEHLPRYNVRLKDDKRYPYIKVHLQEDFPRVTTTRLMEEDGARYFGPYTAAWAAYQTLDLVRKIFPYRTCTREITGSDARPCLYYDIGRCIGPCIGAVSRQDYREMVDGLCRFLEGKTESVVEELREKMQRASEALEFERAAALRDQITAIERVVEKQKVVSGRMADEDVVAFARSDGDACVQVFFIRGGKLVGREYVLLDGTADEDDESIMTSFLKQFYDRVANVPPRILLPNEVDECMIIRDWLQDKRGGRVTISVPRRGQKKELVKMAAENAAETLAYLRAQWQMDEGKQNAAIAELQDALELPGAPLRIECYDVSTLQGTATTASMVVFVKGVPRKSDYRRFKIRAVEGQDDYASMQEALRRRFNRMRGEGYAATDSPGAKDSPDSWKMVPDLLVVDGGRGQLNAALDVLEEYGLAETIPAIGLAKREEEVYAPYREEPLRLERNSQALFLLQRIRDEAHRFAVAYHRKLRSSQTIRSALEQIPGVGQKRRQALLKRFGSVDAIRRASVDEIAETPTITRRLAEQIKSLL